MIIWAYISFFIVGILVAALAATWYYLLKFSKIIMVFEDDISDLLFILNDVEDTIQNVLSMQIFYDSPEVRKEVDQILESVRVCRVSINKTIQRFTDRSKQQYYFIDQDEISTKNEHVIPRLPGQPPDTPNPLQMIQTEGIILDVHHQRNR